MTRALALLAVCAACSGLQKIDDGPAVCGNGLIELGEDCDSSDPTATFQCQQCAIACNAAEPRCPNDYTCGVDRLCHAPSGRFRTATATLPFDVLGFGLTDVDADGYNDVVSLSNTSLSVRYGDALGRLDNVATILIPNLLGTPAVTKLDKDDTLDIVIPTADGLVAYTSPFQTMSPFAFAIELDTSSPMFDSKPLIAFSLQGPYLALLVVTASTGRLGIITLDGTHKNLFGAMPPPVQPVCGAMKPGYDPELSDEYNTGASRVVSLANDNNELCVIEIRPTFPATNPTTFTATWSYKGGLGIGSRPVLANLATAPGCPSVVAKINTDIVEYPAAGSLALGSACSVTFPASPRILASSVGMLTPRGHVALQPPITNDGLDAVATNTGGIYAAPLGGTAVQLFQSLRGIAEIRSLDANHDGRGDAVASAPSSDDLDVLYRFGTGTGAPGADGFLAVSIDTLGVPLHLLVGDFDGDGIDDITYSEKLGSQTLGTFERLMVAYGTTDQVHTPSLVSTYKDIVETGTVQLASSTDPTMRVLDMSVLDSVHDENDMRIPNLLELSVLLGSPQRTLTPYFDAGLAPGAPYLAALAGSFSSAPAAGGYQDLLALQYNGEAIVTEIEPTTHGAMSAHALGMTAGIVCSKSSSQMPCLELTPNKPTAFAPWRSTADDAFEWVFGVDSSVEHDVVAFDPRSLATIMPPTPPVPTDIPLDAIALSSLGIESSLAAGPPLLGDVDGDGHDELVIPYGPDAHAGVSGAGPGHIVTCTHDGAIDCRELLVPDLAGWACIAAAFANVTEHHFPDPSPPTTVSLVALCHAGSEAAVWRIDYSSAGAHATKLVGVPQTVRAIQLQDVTGDGVADLLAVDHLADNVEVLHVYPQCTSRDAGCGVVTEAAQ